MDYTRKYFYKLVEKTTPIKDSAIFGQNRDSQQYIGKTFIEGFIAKENEKFLAIKDGHRVDYYKKIERSKDKAYGWQVKEVSKEETNISLNTF